MTKLTAPKKNAKSTLSTDQKTFNRLKAKVENLQQVLETTHKELNHALSFYHEKVLPATKATKTPLKKCIKLMYLHYKKPVKRSKKDLTDFKSIILYKIDELLTASAINDADPEMCAIFKELNGFDYREIASAEFSDMKAGLEEMLKDEGIDIDLSHINANEDEEDSLRKIFAAIAEAREKMQENEPIPKTKTKRELEKEKKIQDLENIQKKGLSTIYKQLAKELHPDLEQNPARKIEKEAMMKKLTIAYEENDLHTLLSLEMDLINRSDEGEGKGRSSSDDQLKIYNSILKDQVETLQERINIEHLHPRFMPIQQYISDDIYAPMESMHLAIRRAHNEAKNYQSVIIELQSNRAEKVLHEIFHEFNR